MGRGLNWGYWAAREKEKKGRERTTEIWAEKAMGRKTEIPFPFQKTFFVKKNILENC
jgi:hypothetical protein